MTKSNIDGFSKQNITLTIGGFWPWNNNKQNITLMDFRDKILLWWLVDFHHEITAYGITSLMACVCRIQATGDHCGQSVFY